jgi:hypothetical protein
MAAALSLGLFPVNPPPAYPKRRRGENTGPSPKDEALEQDWTNPPAAGYGGTGTGPAGVDAGLAATDTRRGANVDAANTTLGTQADEPLTTTDTGYAAGDRLAGTVASTTELALMPGNWAITGV